MTPWAKVVEATEGHNIDEVTVHLDNEGRSWTYFQCSCYPASEPFRESWMFTDHIRRIVFDALSAVGSAVEGPESGGDERIRTAE